MIDGADAVSFCQCGQACIKERQWFVGGIQGFAEEGGELNSAGCSCFCITIWAVSVREWLSGRLCRGPGHALIPACDGRLVTCCGKVSAQKER